MKFVGLVSGGKDSIYTICKLMDEGHVLVALVHLSTTEPYSDSYMYQTVGSEVASLLGKCFEVPIYVFKTSCKTIDISLEYTQSAGDEVEDLFNALSLVKSKHELEGVSSGAILSTYQKNRVANVCKRLGLDSLTPLWKRDQKKLLSEMIEYGIDARIVKIASSALEKSCLNMNLFEIREYMDNRNYKYGMNYCGEGGEYETLTFDCKHFKNKILANSFKVLSHPQEKDRSDGVYFLEFENLVVEPKRPARHLCKV